MKPPVRLVPDTISHDTVKCLQTLSRQAREGELLGIAFAAMYRGRTFVVNTAGECHRSPVFTRGMVSCLDDELRRLLGGDGG